MENHPIPQDITGFQFKLIGNMTVRQFVYLAVGAIFAWIFFFILGLPALIKWPLSIISFSIGALFAFVPIDGRPMDTMLANFIRAIVSPTQFIYQKEGRNLTDEAPIAPPQPIAYTQAQVAQFPKPVVESNPVITPQETTPSPIYFSSPPIIEDNKNNLSEELVKKDKELNETKEEINKLQEEMKKLKAELDMATKEKNEALSAPPPPPPPVPVPQSPSPEQIALEKQLIESNREKEALEKQLIEIKSKSVSKKTFIPAVAKPAETSKTVRSVPFGMEKSVGIPSIPEEPNLITGIVKDPRGNPLQNILVEVKDQDSNPVRAFKTNGLGKFASATSLSNGKYLISFEDTKETHKFDTVQIELIGVPVMPLEIISVDSREELRRELFN